MTREKLLYKYRSRLLVLKENNKTKIKKDNYPYDLDIRTTKEIIRDLERLTH